MDRESSQKGGTIILDIVGADARLDEEHGHTGRDVDGPGLRLRLAADCERAKFARHVGA